MGTSKLCTRQSKWEANKFIFMVRIIFKFYLDGYSDIIAKWAVRSD